MNILGDIVMERVLITGGAGFIGSEIVDQLNKKGKYEITVIDSLTKQIHGEDWEQSYSYKKIQGKCNFIKADVRNLEAIKGEVVSSDYIIHLAAKIGTG